MDKILKASIILLVCAALGFSCEEKRPDEILTAAEMVQIMRELYVVEEKVNRLAVARDSAKQVAAFLNGKVFAAAGTTDSTFRRSIDYYMERPKEMERIYTALVDTLQLQEQRAPYRVDEP